MIGAIKGFSQISRYALSKKEQKRQEQNQFTLEMMKNEMWKRKLREQAEQAEAQRNLLMEREKERTKQEIAKQQRMYQEHQEEMGMRETELDIEQQKLDIQREKAKGKTEGKAGRDDKLKRLDTLLELRPIYGGQLGPYEKETFGAEGPVTTKTRRFYGRQPHELQYIDQLIKQLSGDIYGTKFKQPQLPAGAGIGTTVQRNRGDLTGAVGKFYSQKKRGTQKSLQEMSNEELFKELLK